MYEFHADKDRYFDMQYRVTREYILPFLQQALPGKKWTRVLEIGSYARLGARLWLRKNHT